jgi:outer membrane protein insertion porin family
MLKRVLLLLVCLLLTSPVWAAQQFLLSDIVVDGNRRVQTIDILNAMKIKPGQTITTADIDAAVQDVYRLGRFSDISAAISEDPAATVLTVTVSERPLVRNVRFEGNDAIDDKTLRGAMTLKVPDLYDPFEVARSIDRVKSEYSKEGYYAAEISADSQVNEDNEATVIFTIKEGEIVRIKDIRFEGNTVFDEDDLEDAMETQEKWIFSWITGRGNYNEPLLQQDLERLADLYFNQGYIRVKVREPVISLVDEGKYMLLLIQIDEGEPYTIGSIDVQGDLLRDKTELLGMVELVPGQVFSRSSLRQGVGAITDLYADQGYAYANVSPLTRVDDQQLSVDLMLDIEQGPQVSVERINITGNTKTRDKVIRREMKLVEGDLYSASKLKKSKQRINNLGFFEEVDISTSAGSDEKTMNVDVNVKERATGTFSVGAGYSSVDGFVAQGSVTQENFLGRGLRLNLAASVGGSSTTYQVGLTDPYFRDTEWTLGFELYSTERDYSDFSRKAKGFALKAGHPVGEFSRVLGTYRFEQKDIYDVSPFASADILDQEGNSTLSSITTSYMYNDTDNRLDPSEGTDFEASWELAGIGGTEHYSKYVIDGRHFWPWRWGTVFSAHGQVGYVHSLDNNDVPIDKRFFLGGIYTLRGFESREVGPQDSNGDYTGGVWEAYSNLEYVFPLYKPLKIKGVTFFDVGNAWEAGDAFNSWRYSTGAGIRWLSPLGPMRFEYGYNLDPKNGEPSAKFDFTIGRFF